jgi:tetratricopeptide (TPR) repeat protein
MRDEHLTPEDLERVLSQDETTCNRLLLHHLAVCPDCYAVGGHILDLYREGAIGIELDTQEISLAASRKEAPRLLAELRGLPASRQKALIHGDRRFRSWGLCELLCEESEREASLHPWAAVALARLAVGVAGVLEEGQPAEAAWLHELRAYALAHLGNGRRVLGDLRGAETVFRTALALWTPAMEEVGDVLGYQAHFLALLASLRRAERRLPEALHLLEEALAADPEPALWLRIVNNLARTYDELGRIDEAIAILEDAKTIAADTADDRTRFLLAHNHLDCLTKAERLAEALTLLPEVRASAAKHGTELDLLRLQWIEARILLDLGAAREATALLEEVCHEFAHRQLAYDAALAGLELAFMHAGRGGDAKVQELVCTILPILRLQNVQREGLFAHRILWEALRRGKVTVELLAQAIGSLRGVEDPYRR